MSAAAPPLTSLVNGTKVLANLRVLLLPGPRHLGRTTTTTSLPTQILLHVRNTLLATYVILFCTVTLTAAEYSFEMVQDRTTGNPLSAGSLSLFMALAMPKTEGSGLKTPTEAIALGVHAGMLAVGFRLIGLGEDERISKLAGRHLTYHRAPPPRVAV